MMMTPSRAKPRTAPPVSGVVYHLRAELAGSPTLNAFRLIAAMRRWAGWRLPPVRALTDPRARVVVRTPARHWLFVEPLWRYDVLVLWEATWRIPVGPDGSWCVRLRVEPFGVATRLVLTAEALRVAAETVPSLMRDGEGVAASPQALVRALVAESPLLIDGVPADGAIRKLRTGRVVAFVTEELCDRSRLLPVVVLSALPERASDGSPIYVIPPEVLGAALVGRAHVRVYETADVGFELSDALGGRERSVFLGALRIYQPGFTLSDDPMRHPLFLPDRLRTLGLDAVQAQIAPPLATNDALTLDLAMLRDERTSLHATTVVSDTATDASATRAASAQREAELRDRLRAMREERAGLLAELETLRADDVGDGAAETPLTVLLDIHAQYGDVLAVHALAIRSASESVFEDTDALRRALTALGDLIRAAQAGSLGQTLHAAFAARGIDYVPHLTEAALSGRLRRQFLRTWDGRQYICADHLRLGSSYDPRFCLRVHFDWSHRDAAGRVLIGHCGRHLDIPTTT